MSKSIQHHLVLAAVVTLVFFTNLGAAHLWDVDEAIFSQVAKEMLARGDRVVPYFNGQMFPEKPAMMYWLMGGAYELFGPTEFAARLPSALFAIGSVFLTYRLGRLMFSPAAGFFAGLILASNVSFAVIARAATPDSPLVFFCTLAVYFFVWGTAKARVQSGELNERNAPWAGQTRFEPSWAAYALAYAAMGCGVLTKGPVGLLLPTAVIGLFLLIVRARPIEKSRQIGWRGALTNAVRRTGRVLSITHFVRTAWSMRPLTAIAVVLAVAGPWYVLVGFKTDGRWLDGFFGVHNFGRFLNAMENHRGPIFYYLAAIAVGFFPWSVLFGPSLSYMNHRIGDNQPWRPGYLLVCSWLAVWIGFFSLAGTKLPNYVVPAYPALALATGSFVSSWSRAPSIVSIVWARLIWGTVALAGLALAFVLPLVAHLFLQDDWILGAVGLIPLSAAAIGYYFSQRGRADGAIATLAGLGVALMLGLLAFGAVHVDRYQPSPRLAKLIADNTAEDQQPVIGAFNYFRPSLVFYTDRTIEQLSSADEVQAFFGRNPANTFVFTTDEHFEQLGGRLPADVIVLDECPKFLGRGRVLLLARLPQTAAAKSDVQPATHRR